MGSPVVWFEVAGRDLDTMTQFYGTLFGWKVDADNLQRYGMVDTGGSGGIPGGVFAPGGDVEYVSFYVEVEDVARSLERAEELGAKVLQPPTPLDSGIPIAMFADPDGQRIGLIERR